MRYDPGKGMTWDSWQGYAGLLKQIEDHIVKMKGILKDRPEQYAQWHFGLLRGLEVQLQMARGHALKLSGAPATNGHSTGSLTTESPETTDCASCGPNSYGKCKDCGAPCAGCCDCLRCSDCGDAIHEDDLNKWCDECGTCRDCCGHPVEVEEAEAPKQLG